MTTGPEPADRAAHWPVVDRVEIYQGHAIKVRRDRITAPHDPEEFERDVVEHVGAVGVLALNERDEVLVLTQYRHPVQAEMVELPAGLRDTPGEPALETAQRELVEEGQVGARRWEPLITVCPSPGTSSERFDVFLASDIVLDQRAENFAATHEEAVMQRAWVPLDTVVRAVLDGRVKNAMLVTAVLALVARRQRNAKE
jgi:ADP-ribose pyrophosphatase